MMRAHSLARHTRPLAIMCVLIAFFYLYSNFTSLRSSYLMLQPQGSTGTTTTHGLIVNHDIPQNATNIEDDRPTLISYMGEVQYLDQKQLDPSFQDVYRVPKQAIFYPTDYYPDYQDDQECKNLYSPLYLEHMASHHAPYCEGPSKSTFECFRTHRAEPFCLGEGVLIDGTRQGKNHTAMHCQLRDFEAERQKATPEVARAMQNLQSVTNMPKGFFETGVAAQMESWDAVASDANVDMGQGKLCTAGTSDGKYYILMKRENHDNVWHKMLEVWQVQVTLDALMMSVNPATKQPYLTPAEAAKIQVIFTEGDEGDKSPADEWWRMIGNGKPLQQRNMPPMCLGKAILPLYSASSPFWGYTWIEADCHDNFLVDAFLKRAYRYMGIKPRKHLGGEEHLSTTNVTLIDRKGRRKLRNQDKMIEDARKRWPRVNFNVVDFAGLTLKEQIILMRDTDVLVGLTGAGLTNIFWLPEEASVAEIQAPNKKDPGLTPYSGFRNLAKMRRLHYFTAHPERREGGDAGWDWQTKEWVDMKNEVFQGLLDAAINAQLAKGEMRDEVLPAAPYADIPIPKEEPPKAEPPKSG